jgi:adenylate cyclase
MLERRLRLWSGLILAGWVILHFINHALGLLSVDAMEAYRGYNAAIWQSPPGTVALYGALALHFLLALRALYRRRTLRMPAWESTRLALGLLIPFLLAGHVIGTRVNQALIGFDIGYPIVLTSLWGDSWLRIKQPVLVLIVWVHLTMGLHYWLRLRPWYGRSLTYLYPVAVLLPLLAIVAYVRAALDMQALTADPAVKAKVFEHLESAAPELREFKDGLEPQVTSALLVMLLAVLAARWIRDRRERRRGVYRIHHSEGKVVLAPIGFSVLEALRKARVPHASVCGGRARCTTCRIRVGSGAERLPPVPRLEAVALQRIKAAPNVRLACQLRPAHDLDIKPLLPAGVSADAAFRPGGVGGYEREVVAVFVDLRDSSRFCEQRLPYDAVFVLNEFFAEMSAAIAATGGHYAQFSGDGLLALYGLKTSIESGCRDAFRGAAEMSRRLSLLNERLRPELDEPLRIGIGIHRGDAIVGTMGPPSTPMLSAVGDNINVAARLEQLTKSYDCTLVVSETTAKCAGFDLSTFPRREADIRGRKKPVAVYAISDPANIGNG